MYLTVLKEWFNYIFPFVIIYFLLFNTIQHYKLLKSSKGNPRAFFTNYMLWFGVKLGLNLTFILVYVLLNRAQALSFVLFFAFCYIVYTIYEVIALIKSLNAGNVK
ncbi:hypothetical protein DLK05_06615 [Ancylomarina longa]|uniref:Uncharacterized protein n=2 Tax=Ancylomarina longa TaxID=2487017 RepID=A0A434AWM1_9BACT|nr:hypothetical protein DLK05_06615 [Ancylomarina longa]